jgi:hypothetical protein
LSAAAAAAALSYRARVYVQEVASGGCLKMYLVSFKRLTGRDVHEVRFQAGRGSYGSRSRHPVPQSRKDGAFRNGV